MFYIFVYPDFGVRKSFLTMYIKKKKNRSGSISIIVAEKIKGKYKALCTIGIAQTESEIASLVGKGCQWIRDKENERYPRLDLFDEGQNTLIDVENFFSNIVNIQVNGDDIILDKVFDLIGFNQIQDKEFRSLVKARLSCPSSKAATVEYLKNHYDEDFDLSKIYRYLDKVNDSHKDTVQEISVHHTMDLLGGYIGVVFYDVTTLYFETDKEDDLRKTGFSKEGRHSNPQIILGLLVSLDGYPLAYCIHEGNKYEGHTMLPVIETFVNRYNLEDFIVVADSGLMNSKNIEELEKLGYKYIIGSRIKNESEKIKQEILSFPKTDRQMHQIQLEGNRRLLIGYTDDRARKDAYNRDKGVRRLEKSYRTGRLSKENINRRGYNKFLEMDGGISVSINRAKIEDDARWDGLKGYLTNTTIPSEQVYAAYHNLWNVERAFRIAKSKIEIRPMFHFIRRRIEAHICICFVALKVYKELERRLKQSNIGMSVDKVLNMAKSITTLTLKVPKTNQLISKTMIMKRHKPIEKLFNDDFWGTR